MCRGRFFQCIVVSTPAAVPLASASRSQLFNFEVHTKVAAPPHAAAADEVTASAAPLRLEESRDRWEA